MKSIYVTNVVLSKVKKILLNEAMYYGSQFVRYTKMSTKGIKL